MMMILMVTMMMMIMVMMMKMIIILLSLPVSDIILQIEAAANIRSHIFLYYPIKGDMCYTIGPPICPKANSK